MRQLATADLAHVLDVARSDLGALRGTSILVTGATGFVGSWLVETAAFANKVAGARIRIHALVPPEMDVEREAGHIIGLEGVSIVRGDIRTVDYTDLTRQSPTLNALDAVVHAAVAVDASTIAWNPMPTLETTVDGTARTLRLARSAGARRFLFLSSGAVYGAPPADLDRIPENHLGGPDPTDPLSVYAEGKRIGETMCACETRVGGIEAVIARAFAFVGPHLPIDRHFAIGNFIRDALGGGPIIVTGDGTPVRSYQYAADMAIWLWALLVRGAPGQAYNVGASHEIAVGAVARLVADQCTPRCAVDIRQAPIPGKAASRYVPDVRLATETLGLGETIALEESIRRTLAWHRAGNG